MQTIRIYIQDIGMEYCIKKCATKQESIKVKELPNQERFRKLGEKENYKYLGIFEADTIKQTKIKEKIRKKYQWTTKNFPKSNSFVKKNHQKNK